MEGNGPTIQRSNGGYRLTQIQWFTSPREVIFEFFADPYNLEKITPGWLSFRVEDCRPFPIREGSLIDYSLRLRGFPIRWLTRISRWDPPRGFTDVMLRGPYGRWEHSHRFRSASGSTEVRDRVEYEMPWEPLGRLAHPLLVRRQLTAIFRYRFRRLREIFADPGGKPRLRG